MKPKNTKFKKYHAVGLKQSFSYKTHLVYSNYGLAIKEPGIITAPQLESIILAVKRTLKRKAKIKDTGKILPGHGGFLDRMDGIIFALPFSYFLLKLFFKVFISFTTAAFPSKVFVFSNFLITSFNGVSNCDLLIV